MDARAEARPSVPGGPRVESAPPSPALSPGVGAASPHPAGREADPPVQHIRRRRGWRAVDVGELWRYRHLLWIFLWRDIKAGQKQTVLGVLWLFIAPLFSVAVFTVVFGRLARIPSDGIPYPLFVFAGYLLWNTFAPAVQAATQSVVSNRQFIQKVYFPRLLIPASAALGGVVNFAIAFSCLLAMMAWYATPVRWTVVLALPLAALVILMALGIGLLLAPLNVKYRDVGRLTQFVVQLWMYLTPVVYPISLVPDGFRPFLALNPAAGYVGAFRWSLYGGDLPADLLATSLTFTLVFLLLGTGVFARTQSRFADVV